MDNALSVIATPETAAIRTLKSGAQSVGFMHRKDYGKKFNLKGAALRKAHDTYRLEFSRKIAGAFAKGVAEDQIHPTHFTQNERGGTVKFVTDLKLGATPATTALRNENAELRAKLAEMEAMLASMTAPATESAPATA